MVLLPFYVQILFDNKALTFVMLTYRSYLKTSFNSVVYYD